MEEITNKLDLFTLAFVGVGGEEDAEAGLVVDGLAGGVFAARVDAVGQHQGSGLRVEHVRRRRVHEARHHLERHLGVRTLAVDVDVDRGRRGFGVGFSGGSRGIFDRGSIGSRGLWLLHLPCAAYPRARERCCFQERALLAEDAGCGHQRQDEGDSNRCDRHDAAVGAADASRST